MDRIIKKKWLSRHGLKLVFTTIAILPFLIVYIYHDGSKSINIKKQNITISRVLKGDFERKKILYNKEVVAPQEFEDATRSYKESKDQVELSIKLAQIDSISYTKRNKHINS